MDSELKPILIDRNELVPKVSNLKRDGYRLIQICATTLPENFEITYSFGKNLEIVHLRFLVSRTDAKIDSITGEYFGAFTYENELQDLFGLKVAGLQLDYKGKFYQKTVQSPFNTTRAEQEAAALSRKAPTMEKKNG